MTVWSGSAPRQAGEEGQVLILVMGFLALVGLFAAALVAESGVNFQGTDTVQRLNDSVAAADGGVSYGIQRVETDPAACSLSLPGIQTINGHVVTVTCAVQTGSALGGLGGWAVITNDSGPSSISDQGGQDPKTIDGPVFNSGGFSLSKTLDVRDGDVVMLDHGNGCTPFPTDPPAPAPPFRYRCSGSLPAVSPSLPPAPPEPGIATLHGTCTVLTPGTYTSATAPGWSGDVYLESGLYYFDGLGSIKPANLFGGAPAASETRFTSGPGACASDPDRSNGSGVEIILGGDSALSLGNQSQMELYSRVPGSSSDGSVAGLSLYQVQSATGGWTASTVTGSSDIVDISGGNTVDAAVHGGIYVPNGSVLLGATNTSHAVVTGGVDAYDLAMRSSASAQFFVNISDNARSQDQDVITAVAKGVNGEKDFVSRAVVQISDFASGTVTIKSWRTCTAGGAGTCTLS
jgi:hypothetical protein